VTEPVRMRGRVARRTYAAGSKSERPAMMIITEDGAEYLLRRVGANPYADPELDTLDGALIEATGRLYRDVLLVEQYRLIDPRRSSTGSPAQPSI
jgi:hypothetical protein